MENKEKKVFVKVVCVAVVVLILVFFSFSRSDKEKSYSVTLDCSEFVVYDEFYSLLIKSEDCIESKIHIKTATGTPFEAKFEYDFSGNNPPQEPKEVIKEVSVVAEAENCKKLGGEFYASGGIFLDIDGKQKIYISCTKTTHEENKEIKETLFEHELKY